MYTGTFVSFILVYVLGYLTLVYIWSNVVQYCDLCSYLQLAAGSVYLYIYIYAYVYVSIERERESERERERARKRERERERERQIRFYVIRCMLCVILRICGIFSGVYVYVLFSIVYMFSAAAMFCWQ